MITLTAKINNVGLSVADNLSLQVCSESPVKTLVNHTKPVYYIDAAAITGTSVEVDYTLNDDWMTASVEIHLLKAFVLKAGLNEYCFDYSHAGDHVQEAGTFEVDTYLNENLSFVIKAYLEAERIGQYNVN